MSFRLTVPGNLLIAGEYCVLEPGGLGLAVALDVRLDLSASPAEELTIVGTLGAQTVRWGASARDRAGLLDMVVRALERRGIAPPAMTIRVDSSAFFRGRKLGYGSSGAVAVAVAAALLRGVQAPCEMPHTPVVLQLALEAHRAHQGGGSGYDVVASACGGVGLFTGGEHPRWEPVEAPWLEGAVLFAGPGPVHTPRSLARYRAWKQDHPKAARDHLERSNDLVLSLVRARTASEARRPFAGLTELGAGLGDAIGASARIRPPSALGTERGFWKAVGAGNEVGVFIALGDRRRHEHETTDLRVSRDGILWS